MPRFLGDSALLNPQQLARKNISKKKVPVWRFPSQIERSYVSNISLLVKQWRNQMVEFIFPQIDDLNQQASFQRPPGSTNVKIDSVRIDDWSDQLDELMKTYNIQIGLDEIRATQELNFTAREVSQFNTKQWFKITNGVIGIPLLQSEPWLESTINSFTKENVALITDLQETTVQRINTTVNRGIKQGLRNKTMKKQLLNGTDLKKGVFKKTQTRAALIARDQIGKLNGQLTQLRQTGVGISRYIWMDVNDSRVRKKHGAMDNRLCRWSDSSVYSNDGGKTWLQRSGIGGVDLHPGQDYQCRCFASPDFSTISLENI